MARKTILFLSDSDQFSGGYLKRFHYFCHARQSRGFEPLLYFTPGADRKPGNPWAAHHIRGIDRVTEPDAYFLAGLDWQTVERLGLEIGRRPVLNLIQDFWCTDRNDPRWHFLPRPATRICVSAGLAEAVRDTGQVNGPVETIEPGVALPDVLWPRSVAPVDVFIGASKNPAVGRAVAFGLSRRDLAVELCDGEIDRGEYLAGLGRAKVAVQLPLAQEGFYMPPIEAALVSAAVVVPDCIGNRGFCRHEQTCLVPAYEVGAIVDCVRRLCEDDGLRMRLLRAAEAEARTYTLARECDAFLRILDGAIFAQVTR